jgi:hypothetical protein
LLVAVELADQETTLLLVLVVVVRFIRLVKPLEHLLLQ